MGFYLVEPFRAKFGKNRPHLEKHPKYENPNGKTGGWEEVKLLEKIVTLK